MKTLWMCSTAVFVFQTAVFLIAHYGFGASFGGAAALGAVAALGGAVAFTALAHAVATAAFAAAFAFTAFVAAFAIAIAVDIAKEEGAREPFWACFIAALPLGIGTVLGGTLYVLMFRKRSASGAAA